MEKNTYAGALTEIALKDLVSYWKAEHSCFPSNE